LLDVGAVIVIDNRDKRFPAANLLEIVHGDLADVARSLRGKRR
jgi:hypothetical protein